MAKVSCAVFAVVAIVFLAVAGLRPDLVFVSRPHAFWTTNLPNGDALECGLQTFPGPFGYRGYHMTYLRWRHGSDARYIYLGSDDRGAVTPLAWATFDIRASQDGKRVWLVWAWEKHPSSVLAAIDLASGQCWNGGGLVDPAMSVADQFRMRRLSGEVSSRGLPQWATPKGGRLMDRLTYEEYRSRR